MSLGGLGPLLPEQINAPGGPRDGSPAPLGDAHMLEGAPSPALSWRTCQSSKGALELFQIPRRSEQCGFEINMTIRFPQDIN